jgi:hypothetical protein
MRVRRSELLLNNRDFRRRPTGKVLRPIFRDHNVFLMHELASRFKRHPGFQCHDNAWLEDTLIIRVH